jgi:hypothetical protein
LAEVAWRASDHRHRQDDEDYFVSLLLIMYVVLPYIEKRRFAHVH